MVYEKKKREYFLLAGSYDCSLMVPSALTTILRFKMDSPPENMFAPLGGVDKFGLQHYAGKFASSSSSSYCSTSSWNLILVNAVLGSNVWMLLYAEDS